MAAKMFSLPAFAEHIGVTKGVVEKWITERGLPVVQFEPRGKRWIDEGVYEKWKSDHTVTVDPPVDPLAGLEIPESKSSVADNMTPIF